MQIELPETAARIGRASNLSEMVQSFGVLLRSRAFVGYTGQAASSMSVFFGFLAGAPYLMITVYERPAFEYGLFFLLVSGAFMLGNFLAARLTPKVGIERMIVLGSVGSLAGCGAALALACLGAWSPLALFVPLGLSGLAQGLALPNTQAAVVSVRPELAGAASGLAGFVQMGTAAIAAQVIGSIQTATPYPMTLGLTLFAALGVVSALVGTRAPD